MDWSRQCILGAFDRLFSDNVGRLGGLSGNLHTENDEGLSTQDICGPFWTVIMPNSACVTVGLDSRVVSL